MSTKVYCAYRVPIEKLNEEISRVEELMRGDAAWFLKHICSRLDDEEHPEDIDKARWLHEQMLESMETNKIHPFDLECGIRIFIHEGWAYLWPWASSQGRGLVAGINRSHGLGIPRDAWDGLMGALPYEGDDGPLNLPEYAESYAYWDNTDPPKYKRPWGEENFEYDDESTWPNYYKEWRARRDFWWDVAGKEAHRLDYMILENDDAPNKPYPLRILSEEVWGDSMLGSRAELKHTIDEMKEEEEEEDDDKDKAGEQTKETDSTEEEHPHG